MASLQRDEAVRLLLSVAILTLSVICALSGCSSLSGERSKIKNALKLRLAVNKATPQPGDKVSFTFEIENVSNNEVHFVRYGGLYAAFWLEVKTDARSVSPEILFEKLYVPDVSEDDIITLKPGEVFRTVRRGTVRPVSSGRVFLDMFDSGFTLERGQQYRLRGEFRAREDRSGKFRVAVGEVFSLPIDFSIGDPHVE
jgi:hypothetical protein